MMRPRIVSTRRLIAMLPPPVPRRLRGFSTTVPRRLRGLPSSSPRWLRGVLLLCLLAATAACANGLDFGFGGPDAGSVPQRPVVVGEIATEKPEWERLARRVRRSLVQQLDDSEGVAGATWRVPVAVPADALVVTGTLDEIDAGSEVARMFIGMGAGAPTLNGRFRVADAAGRTLVILEREVAYTAEGGTSTHFSPLDMDDLARDFAEGTADAIVAWMAEARPEAGAAARTAP
jgi:hypothetical protein